MRSLTKLALTIILLAGFNGAFATTATPAKPDSLELMDRKVSNFNGLKIEGPFDVYITQGSVESVKLKAPAEILDRIVTEVSGGVLKIHNKHDNWGRGEKSWWSDKSWWHNHENIVVYVTLKNLNSLSTSGRSQAYFENGLTTDILRLRVSGSGHMIGKVDVKSLTTSISGSGFIKLSGSAESSTIKVTGSGNFTAPALVTSNSAVKVSGSGDVKINANDRIDAAISGSGGVSYTGTAKVITSNKSGSGNISRF